MKKITRLASVLASIMLMTGTVYFTGCSHEDDGPNIKQSADGTKTLIINENDKKSGFISAVMADGTAVKINTVNVNDAYSGDGYLDNPNTIVYSIKSEVDQEVSMSIRYAHWGWTDQIKAAYITVGGTTYKDEDKILYCNHTGKALADSNTVKIPLKTGNNQIRLTPVPKGTVLPKWDESKGYGVKYPNGTADEDKAKTDTNVAGLYKADGLIANLDYLKIVGKNIGAGGAITEKYYSVKTSVTNTAYGSITISPEGDSFVENTEITVTATAAEGYVFDSWCGTSTEKTASFKVKITDDLVFKANFISATFDKSTLSGLTGYATVCDDDGSAYTVTGGTGGQEIIIASLEDLTVTYKDIIKNDEPYIIHVAARISAKEWIDTPAYTAELTKLTAAGKSEAEARFILDNRSITFDFGANKTIIGEPGKDYGFHNINPKISKSNVIVKYIHFGDVIGDDYFGGSGNDALSIKGGEHVWIDHCEFSSSLKPKDVNGNVLTVTDSGKDYVMIGDYKLPVDLEGESTTASEKWAKDFYDGLLDISETSRFISVSNSYFHDHWKACLCGGSNDKEETQPQGSQVRMTFYRNYFKNIHARQPLFRFGRAHIFSSFYDGIAGDSTGIEVRAESKVYVDNCNFQNIRSDRTVGCWNSSSGDGVLGAGTWTVKDCVGQTDSNSAGFTPPYDWSSVKLTAADSKTQLPSTAGIPVAE